MTWDTPLSEPIALTSGRQRFQTLRDAATFLSKRYANAKGGVLAGALRDLMAGAENPTEDAVGRAAHQFARFLARESDQGYAGLKDYGEGLEQRIRDMLAGGRSASLSKMGKGR